MQMRLRFRGRSMALGLICLALGGIHCARLLADDPQPTESPDPFETEPVAVASDLDDDAEASPSDEPSEQDKPEPSKLEPTLADPPTAEVGESAEPAHLPEPSEAPRHAATRPAKPEQSAAAPGHLKSVKSPRNPAEITPRDGRKSTPAKKNAAAQSEPAQTESTQPHTVESPAPRPIATKTRPQIELKVEAASFRSVQPGRSKLSDVQTALGEGQETTHEGNSRTLSYEIKPFKEVRVTLVDDLVTSIALQLTRPHTPEELVDRLKLQQVRGVDVPDEQGRSLGRVFPERGVLFSYVAVEGSASVDQILLEATDPSAFVLRAESQLHGPYLANLADLDYAIGRVADNAHAHWLRGRIWLSVGDLDEAALSIQTARQIEPKNVQYRLTWAQCLVQQGKHDASLAEIKAVLAQRNLEPIVQAQALLQLGDLLIDGPARDDKQAIESHQRAIALADPLAVDPRVAVRRSAKEVFINAHLGVARDVGWGHWNRKPEVVPKWIERAMAFADEMIDNDGGSVELRLRVLDQALAACVGFKPSVNPTPLVEEAEEVAAELLGHHDDGLWRQRIHWQLGRACSHAVRIAHARSDFEQGLKFAELAQTNFEEGSEARENNAQARNEAGRLYFGVGALYAVHRNDHETAVAWYDKAVDLLMFGNDGEPSDTARLGEALVSMGVSYWEVDQRQKAMELTQKGTGLIERAVESGHERRTALAVPYGNLASMHREMGDRKRAQNFNQLAEKSESPDRQ